VKVARTVLRRAMLGNRCRLSDPATYQLAQFTALWADGNCGPDTLKEGSGQASA
jgi:hypothetical protein